MSALVQPASSERIREDRQAVEGAIIVDRSGDGLNGRREPSGIADDGAEGIAEDVAEEVSLGELLIDLMLNTRRCRCYHCNGVFDPHHGGVRGV